jgi:hypothetical protein
VTPSLVSPVAGLSRANRLDPALKNLARRPNFGEGGITDTNVDAVVKLTAIESDRVGQVLAGNCGPAHLSVQVGLVGVRADGFSSGQLCDGFELRPGRFSASHGLCNVQENAGYTHELVKERS